MAKHQWVQITMTPVEVEVEEALPGYKQVKVFATEAALEIADEDTKVGCWHCDTMVTPDNIDDDCPGEEDGA